MRRISLGVAVFLTLGAMLGGCDLGGGDSDGGGPAESSAPAQGEPMDLEVLVYNVEYGGGPETDAVIREIDADVVGVLESYGRLPEIARKTGYPYYNSSLQLLSKYPILEPSGGDGLYAMLEVEPGYAIPFFNVHLDYVAWGPRMLKNGRPVEEVIASENEVRTSAMEQPFAAMDELLADGYPIFLTGDFNQPSSLDYVEETVGSRPEIPEPVAWPVSEELFEMGFRDSYREIHPDPLEDPGTTHRSGERIDYVYAGGPSTTVDSQLVGERGGEGVEIEFDDWISDHQAVLSTFEVAPVAMPTQVAVDARLGTVGDEVRVFHNTPGGGDGEIVVVPEGGGVDEALETFEAEGERSEGTVDTAGWEPGGYDVVLVGDDGAETARVSFFLRDPQARLELSTDRSTYAPGEPIGVTWARAPANRWDWLGVFKASADDPEKDDYLIWQYAAGHSAGTLPATTDGGATLGPDSQNEPWPLPPGDYVVNYLLADQYDSAGAAEFSVRGSE